MKIQPFTKARNVLTQAIAVIMIAVLLMAALPITQAQAAAQARPFAAVGQRGAATTATVLNNASLIISKPTGVVAGDVLIANLAQINSLTPPTASGWTLANGTSLAGGTNRYMAVFYKVAGAAEPASYTFTVPTGGTVRAAGAIVAFSDVNTSTGPLDLAAGTITVGASGTTVTDAAITTVSPNDVVIMLGAAVNSIPTWSGWTTTSPGALTELYDFQATNISIGAAWATKATASTTGTGSATLSAAERNGGMLLALKPKTDPTLSVSNPSVAYNGAAQAATVTGSVAGTVGNVRYGGSATVPTNVGTYAITADFTPTDTGAYHSLVGAAAGNFVITAKALSITANNGSKTYGTAFTVGSGSTAFTSLGLVGSDSVTSVTLASTGAAATATVAGSPYPIVPSLAVGTGLTNYTISYNNGSLAVTAKALSVTANNGSKTYGTAFTVGSGSTAFTSLGLVNSDTVTSVTLASTGAATTATVAGSPYPIVPSAAVGTGLANYTISYNNGSLAVGKATLDVTAGDSITYGGTANLAPQYTGFVLSQDHTALTTEPTCSAGAGPFGVTGSPYTVSCSGGVADNYSFHYTDGSLVVGKATLDVTAGDSITYGGTANLAPQYTGFVLSQDHTALTTEPTCSAGAGPFGVTGSPYTVSCSGGVADNYAFHYTDGSLVVGKATLDVTAGDSITYGGTANLAPQYTGFVLSQDHTALTTEPTCSAGAGPFGVTGSPYTVSCSGGVADNYAFHYTDGSLVVGKATLDVTAGDSITYGGTANLAPQYTGFVLSQDHTALTTEPTCSAGAGPFGVSGSPYTVSCSGGVADNYSFHYTDGSLVVGKATLDVTAGDSITYGGTANLAPQYTGFVLSQDHTALTTEPTCSAGAGPFGVTGSPYTVSCSGGVADNYAFHYTDGSLVVGKATLDVTAGDSITYGGTANLAPQYTGFVLSQDHTALTTEPTCSAGAGPFGVSGSPYTVSCSGGVADNYSFHYTDGSLTVNAKTINVTADAKSKVVGALDPELTYTNDPLVSPDIFTGELARNPGETPGTYPITQGTLALNSNYDLVFHGALLTISATENAPVITEGASTSVSMNVNGKPKAFSLSLHATDIDVADTLTWSLTAPAAAHGTPSASGTGASVVVGYAPAHNFAGSDSFGVQVSDGTLTDTITVTVNITQPTLTFRSVAALDGYVLESGENTNVGGSVNPIQLIVGDNKLNDQYRGILSFNTAGLPDNAVVTQITLKVKKAGIFGTGNPFATLGNILVDVRKGNFGLAGLQITDFQALPTRSGAFTIKNNPLTGGWYFGSLGTPANVLVNKTGNTQMRLRFTKDDNNNHLANYFTFFSGNSSAANRPVLLIQYYVP